MWIDSKRRILSAFLRFLKKNPDDDDTLIFFHSNARFDQNATAAAARRRRRRRQQGSGGSATTARARYAFDRLDGSCSSLRACVFFIVLRNARILGIKKSTMVSSYFKEI